MNIISTDEHRLADEFTINSSIL
jgi:hypothetical protein